MNKAMQFFLGTLALIAGGAAMAAGEATRNEEWITYASDGRHVLLETTKVPMRAPDGKLLGVLGISHDITQQQAYEQELLVHREHLEKRRTHRLPLNSSNQALC